MNKSCIGLACALLSLMPVLSASAAPVISQGSKASQLPARRSSVFLLSPLSIEILSGGKDIGSLMISFGSNVSIQADNFEDIAYGSRISAKGNVLITVLGFNDNPLFHIKVEEVRFQKLEPRPPPGPPPIFHNLPEQPLPRQN